MSSNEPLFNLFKVLLDEISLDRYFEAIFGEGRCGIGPHERFQSVPNLRSFCACIFPQVPKS